VADLEKGIPGENRGVENAPDHVVTTAKKRRMRTPGMIPSTSKEEGIELPKKEG
jgi:hypothetical protein